jgi:hypothetical protein
MKTKSLLIVSMLMVSVASTLVGCAKDMDPDDYRQQEVQDEQTKIQAVAGTYRGALVSNGATVGGFTFTFGPSLTVASSSDDIAEQQVVMSGSMTITTQNQDAKILNFSNGSFYDVTQSFSITIPVSTITSTSATPTTQSAAVVQVNGTFNNDGTLSGSVQANNYPNTTATFSLSKDGVLPATSSLSSNDQYVMSELPSFQYTGTANVTSGMFVGTNKTAQMTIVNADSTRPDLAFYDFFLPIKAVSATISFGSDGSLADLIVPNAEWDLREGTLTGSTVSSTEGDSSYSSNFQCTAGQGAAGQTWTCSYLSAAGNITMSFNQTK